MKVEIKFWVFIITRDNLYTVVTGVNYPLSLTKAKLSTDTLDIE
jgi:hypothetical protein